MSIKPATWNKPWRVKFKINVYCPNYATYNSYTYATFTGRQSGLSYSNWNEFDTSAYSYLIFNPLTQTGFNAGYSHAIGMSVFYSTNYTSSSYYRNFKVSLFETENCTVTLLDTPVLFANWTGGNSTNYTSSVNTTCASRGLQETGDSNDPNYRSRIYYSNRYTTYTNLYRYQILLQKTDKVLLPINAVSNSIATTKVLTTETFDPFGDIFYYDSTNTYAANAAIGTKAVLYRQRESVDLRYSFNTGETLIDGDPVYLVAQPTVDGKAILASTPIKQTLPTSNDGLIYILLGKAIENASIELRAEHPVYKYRNGKNVRIFNVQQMVGATVSEAGDSGVVPAPSAGKNSSFLRGDATWALPKTAIASTSQPSGQSAGEIWLVLKES